MRGAAALTQCFGQHLDTHTHTHTHKHTPCPARAPEWWQCKGIKHWTATTTWCAHALPSIVAIIQCITQCS
eukprot:3308942-Pyramimonas_sp.AAC.2